MPPDEEWDRLAVRFGVRFLRRHDEICAELDRVLGNSRPRSRSLVLELDRAPLGEIDDGQLMDLLAFLRNRQARFFTVLLPRLRPLHRDQLR